jgi:hypothetical protein
VKGRGLQAWLGFVDMLCCEGSWDDGGGVRLQNATASSVARVCVTVGESCKGALGWGRRAWLFVLLLSVEWKHMSKLYDMSLFTAFV